MQRSLRLLIFIISLPVYAQNTGSEVETVRPEQAENRVSDDEPAVSPDLSNKRKLLPVQQKNKREGDYITGIGGPASDPDSGFIVGGTIAWFFNGSRDEPTFNYTPYNHRVRFNVAVSTRGLQNYTLDYDAPFIGMSNYRIRANVYYVKNIVATYFGTGTETMGSLTHPDGRRFSSYSDYNSALREVKNNNTNSYYNYYKLTRPGAGFLLERNLFGGLLRAQTGFLLTHYSIDDYSGETVPAASDSEAVMNETLLRKDYEAGRITGFNGGFNNSLKLGLAYDTRDLEPNPKSGMFHDITLSLFKPALGAEYNYEDITTALRFYNSPFSEFSFADYFDPVFALRGAYSVKSGDVPFFAMGHLNYTEGEHPGLGGLRTLRGYRINRFRGPVMMLYNVEMRYTFYQGKWGSEDIQWMFVPFVDTGRVFNRVEDTQLSGFKTSYGAGLRVVWNQATVITFDFGFSDEDAGFYMNIEHIF